MGPLLVHAEGDPVTELESLARLIAGLHAQILGLQAELEAAYAEGARLRAENAELRQAAEPGDRQPAT